MYVKTVLWMTLGVLTVFPSVFGTPQVQKIYTSVVDDNALTIDGAYGQAINGLSFQQEAVVSRNGYQYVTYYNENRHVCLARRQLPTGLWQIIEFTDYDFLGDDAHNTISVGICPNDGTIHLAFDHHGETLHYRVSQTGAASNPGSTSWNASLFGPVISYLEVGKTVTALTYPAFVQTPSGDLQMIYRFGSSGNGDWVIADYSGSSHLWSNTRLFISRSGTFTDEYGTSTARCAYPNRYDYGPNGKLHVSWCWREQQDNGLTGNHDIMYSYSADGGITWLNDRDSTLKISVPGSLLQTLLRFNASSGADKIIGLATGELATQQLIRIDSPGVTVVKIPRNYGLINTQAQAIDPQGRAHVVMWHCSDASFAEAAQQGYPSDDWRWGNPYARRYNHYWRDSSGKWNHYEMPWVAGNRPQMFIRSNGDAFLIYNMSRDPELMDSEVFFIDGDLQIAAASAASGWTDWQIVHTEPGLFLNEMLADPVRFKQDGILSIMVQESPETPSVPTRLRILDFQCN
jgi:hypothetical protein